LEVPFGALRVSVHEAGYDKEFIGVGAGANGKALAAAVSAIAFYGPEEFILRDGINHAEDRFSPV
jgi:hypothetical protein